MTARISSVPTAASRLRLALLAYLGIKYLTVGLSYLFLGEKSIWPDKAISIAIAQSGWSTL